jgi:hypothetical protein
MRNKWFFTLGVLLVFGFVFTACDNGTPSSDDDVFAGTWVSSQMKLVASNGSFKEYMVPSNNEIVRGTYTVSGTTVSAKVTEVNTSVFGGADAWVAYANLSDAEKGLLGMPDGNTMQITITGNSWTANGQTFTKQ